MSGQTVTPSLRCASVARAAGYRPGGTVVSARSFVLVETPLPWPSDVADHPLLRPLAPVLAAHAARVQALVPVDRSNDHVRVVVYRQPQDDVTTAQAYVRDEAVVPPDQLVETVAALLAGSEPGARDDGGHSHHDVLVCTHGSRDVCCGRDGITVHRDLMALDLPGVRVWRTSHTGGHRFAPTALTFPEGRAWASVDTELLAGIVDRSADPAVASGHDRGCAALPDPFTQVADGAVLAAEGWSWLDRSRWVESMVDGGDGRRTVTLTGSRAPGQPEPVDYRVEVAVRRVVPVPDCGRPLEEARKTSTEVEVVGLERIPTRSSGG
jgi:hypothetical protein